MKLNISFEIEPTEIPAIVDSFRLIGVESVELIQRLAKEDNNLNRIREVMNIFNGGGFIDSKFNLSQLVGEAKSFKPKEEPIGEKEECIKEKHFGWKYPDPDFDSYWNRGVCDAVKKANDVIVESTTLPEEYIEEFIHYFHPIYDLMITDRPNSNKETDIHMARIVKGVIDSYKNKINPRTYSVLLDCYNCLIDSLES